jgi:hypothetical protein
MTKFRPEQKLGFEQGKTRQLLMFDETQEVFDDDHNEKRPVPDEKSD